MRNYCPGCERRKEEMRLEYEKARAMGFQRGFHEGLQLLTKEIAAARDLRPTVYVMPASTPLAKELHRADDEKLRRRGEG